tara:strand:- start:959 stop:1831 length:873 start_codon:yes stop_codon:yes gene_type:complete
MSKYTDELQKTATIITNQMLEHGSDWTKCWTTTGKGLPINATTKNAYRGFNVWRLLTAIAEHGFTSNEFVTYKQAKQSGGSVLKGSTGTKIMFFSRTVVDDKDKPEEKKAVGFWKVYTVFNLDQTEGLDHLVEVIEVPDKASTIDNVQEFIDNCQAVIKFGGDRAFYSPGHDHIQMPNIDRFEDSYGYYATMLHELVHWTMKENRSDRPNSSSHSEYAFEELVAETGSALLCVMLGIESEPRPDHAKYLNSWIKAIKDNPKVIQQAFSKSQKAIDYLYSLQDQEEVKIAA